MLCLKFAVASFPRFVLLGIDFASPAVMSKLEIFANELVTAIISRLLVAADYVLDERVDSRQKEEPRWRSFRQKEEPRWRSFHFIEHLVEWTRNDN